MYNIFDYYKGKKILYVHGFGSSGSTHTAILLEQKLPEAKILHPDLPISPLEMLPFLQLVCEREHPDLIIGTSMGAMLTEKLRGYDRICVNPAMHMEQSLGTSIKFGEIELLNPRADGITKINVTKSMAKEFAEICQQNYLGLDAIDAQRVTGLFGLHDTVVNHYEEFSQHYPHCAYFDGEHRLNDGVLVHTLLPIIGRYWVRSSGQKLEKIFVDWHTLCNSAGQARPSARLAIETLQESYDVYIVAPTKLQPQKWLEQNIGIGAWERLVLCDHPDLLLGEYYISCDASVEEITIASFLHFGGANFKNWDMLLDFFKQIKNK